MSLREAIVRRLLVVVSLAGSHCGGPTLPNPLDNLYPWVNATLQVTSVKPPGSNYPPGTVVDGADSGVLRVEAESSFCFGELSPFDTVDDIVLSSSLSVNNSASVITSFMAGSLKGGEVKVDASHVSTVTLDVTGIKRSRIGTAQLQELSAAPTFRESCKEQMRLHPTIIEGFFLSQVNLTFFDTKGVKIDLSKVPISDVVTVGANANVSVDEKGGVSWKTPVYVGFRSELINPR